MKSFVHQASIVPQNFQKSFVLLRTKGCETQAWNAHNGILKYTYFSYIHQLNNL